MIFNKVIVFLMLVLSTHFSFAGEPQVAQIDGSKAKVQLYFTPKMQAMLEHFKRWEALLKTKNLDTTFYLASGDFRRAILDIDVEGPGDVEILIHFNNQNIKPLTLANALDLLKANGVDLKAELHALFGAEKKLDVFVKDRFVLENQGPYTGELGLFEGMGDTSINQLRYSPSRNTVEGDKANLEALRESRILFLERNKTSKLPEAKKITNVKGSTEYPATILRLALRSIRLETEILLSPNPNKLFLDESFSEVLRGFELFFSEVLAKNELTGLSAFKLDETYIEQFLKIFRGRTLEERKIIDKFLNEKHPDALKLWSGLGLDYREIIKTGNERAAIIGNAHYENIRPYVDKKLNVLNPFEKNRLTPLIPDNILREYSARLHYLVHNFEAFKFDAQLGIINQYLTASKYLQKSAAARLKERTFLDNHVKRFSHLDPSTIDAKDPRTLVDLLVEAGQPKLLKYRNAQLDESDKTFKDLLAQTKELKAKGKTPILVLDLDGVFFFWSAARLKTLQLFDKLNKTNYFSNVTVDQIEQGDLKDVIFQALDGKIKKPTELVEVAEEAIEFSFRNAMSEEFYAAQEVNKDLIERLQPIFEAGAVPFYLTARPEFTAAYTEAGLARAQLPKGKVQHKTDPKISVPDYKLQAIEKYKADNKGSEILAFLDDNRSTIESIRKSESGIQAYRLHTRREKGGWTTFLSNEEGAEHRIYGTVAAKNRKDCEELLSR